MSEENARKSDRLADFLELFYPIHYKIGMALEDALRVGELTRKQVAILWLIRCEGKDGRSMRRKDIQRLLTTWFEISNSTITKALRSMSRAPLSLLRVLEDPRSGREKQIVLTAKGGRFLLTMVERGRAFLRPIIAELSQEETQEGLRFLKNVTSILERSLAAGPPGEGPLASRNGAPSPERNRKRLAAAASASA